MNASPSILEASRLNHEAANSIRNEQYDDAISSLARGMTILKQALPLCTGGVDEMDGSQMSSSCEPCSEESVYFMEAEPSKMADSEGTCQDFVFRRAILMHLNENEMFDSRTAVKLSAIMMFNLALSQHLNATRCTSTTDSYEKLHAAMLLYENAYLLQQNEEFEICPLYNLALSNNLGQVLKTLKHDLEATECFEQLLSILVYVVDSYDEFEREQLEGFFRNTAPLMIQTSVAAAA